MAFGTGNHPTTRLCVEGLLGFSADLDPQLRKELNIVDAGCGSGILALSASLLGFSRISAFDIDADSIRICHENAIMNQLEGAVSFTECGLDDGLPSGKADLLLANILANVLTDYRESLLLALRDKPGSTLVLSGILQKEVETLTNAFQGVRKVTQPAISNFSSRSRSMVLCHLRQTSKSICLTCHWATIVGY